MSVTITSLCNCSKVCATNLGTCVEDWGGHCGRNNCLVLRVCESNKWVIPMYGCHPTTGKDLKFSDITLSEFEAEYHNGEGYVSVLDGSVAITGASSYSMCLKIEPQATGYNFADGSHALNGRIYITVDGSRYLYYEGDICVEQKPVPAPPKLMIACDVTLLVATLTLTNSDVVHAGRVFGDVTIDWGDDTVETVPYADVLTHTYTTDGIYCVMITACLERLDATDVCEPEICETATFDLCVDYVTPLGLAASC